MLAHINGQSLLIVNLLQVFAVKVMTILYVLREIVDLIMFNVVVLLLYESSIIFYSSLLSE